MSFECRVSRPTCIGRRHNEYAALALLLSDPPKRRGPTPCGASMISTQYVGVKSRDYPQPCAARKALQDGRLSEVFQFSTRRCARFSTACGKRGEAQTIIPRSTGSAGGRGTGEEAGVLASGESVHGLASSSAAAAEPREGITIQHLVGTVFARGCRCALQAVPSAGGKVPLAGMVLPW